MHRDLDELETTKFDVLVIGGGIYGACIARDATLRGLKVCLIEAQDFSGQTSHNSLKIIHGGIRYFQHLNFKRVAQSIREREIWANTAKHYIRPLKFVIPTYGYATRGPLALGAAITMHNLFNFAQNIKSKEKFYPKGSLISKTTCQKLIPFIQEDNITGGAQWFDGQIIDADRLLIELIKDAVNNGLAAANYLRANEIIVSSGIAKGAHVVDQISNRAFNISASLVVNATGPWAYKLLHTIVNDKKKYTNQPLSKSFNVVIDTMRYDYAFGLKSKRESDAVIGKSDRIYFFTPWLNKTIIGTAHLTHDNSNNLNTDVSSDIQEYLDEINSACPTLNLSKDSVRYVYSGFTPAENTDQLQEVKRSHHSNLIDHGAQDNICNLISVIGVKYTTARLVAEQAVDLIVSILNRGNKNRKVCSHLLEESSKCVDNVSMLDKLSLEDFPNKENVLNEFKHSAESHIHTSINRDMTIMLQDYLIRRTNLLVRGYLGKEQLEHAADVMARYFNWSNDEKARQINSVAQKIPSVERM